MTADPGRTRSMQMGGSAAEILATAALAAASGCDLEEKVHEILEAAERILPVEGWMVWQVNPATGQRERLFAKGYPPHLMAYLDGPDFETDVVTPFGQASGGWPARVRDLPYHPSELRCMSEYYLPVGFVEGLVAPLASRGAGWAGYLDCSSSDHRHPSDEARTLMKQLALILGRLVDPLEETGRAAAALAGDEWILLVGAPVGEDSLPGRTSCLRPIGLEAEAETYFEDLLGIVGCANGRWWASMFLWEGPVGEWYRCRALRSRTGDALIGVSRIERRPYGLSRRELEVLTLLAEGMNNDEIAKHIVVTVRTVKAHVEHILEKLDLPTRSAATRAAIDEGLLLRPASVLGAPESRTSAH